MPTWAPYPDFVNPGDNAWQLTAATLVGLMSVPGLVVLYGGVMQKRWSVNSMMMAFVAFARAYEEVNGHVFVFFVITVAAAEVAVGLALIVAIFHAKQSIDVDEVSSLKG